MRLGEMDCATVQTELSGWIDGELAQPRAGQIQEHAVHCLNCRKTLEALEGVGSRLAVLKAFGRDEPPAGLTAGLMGMPAWWVALAVGRRWFPAGGAVAVAVAGWLFLQNLSMPLSATVTIGQAREERTLTPGTLLTAQPGQPVDVAFLPEGGTMRLRGNAALVVHQAQRRWMGADQQMEFSLPSGSAWVTFGPAGPPHQVLLTTPHALVRLTGTQVLVEAAPGQTRVSVFEGEADVLELASGRRVLLARSQAAQIRAGSMEIGSVFAQEWTAGSAPVSSVPPPALHETGEEEGKQGSPKAPAAQQLWYEVK